MHTHHRPGSSPPSFFPQKQFSQPQECRAIFSGSSASPLLLSHVRMCHSTELCKYMLGGFFSAGTRSAHKWFKNRTGCLCTSLPGAQRPLYRFYTKIFLLRSLLPLVWKLLTTRGGRRSVLHFTSNTILNRRMTTSGESFLYRLVGFWVNQF